jgi:hypothetical protein
MKDNEKMTGLRDDYIATLAELASLGCDRESHLTSNCGGYNAIRSASVTSESLTTVETINKKIADTCNKLRAIEQRARGEIGIPALFGTDVPNVIRVAASLLAGKSLSGGFHHETRRLGDFLLPVAGNTPQDLVTVREAFRKSGLLRPHIHCTLGRTIDEMENLTFTESAFRKLLALEPDSECEDLIKARELLSSSVTTLNGKGRML